MIKNSERPLHFLDELTNFLSRLLKQIRSTQMVRYFTMIERNDSPLYFSDALTSFISRLMKRISTKLVGH